MPAGIAVWRSESEIARQPGFIVQTQKVAVRCPCTIGINNLHTGCIKTPGQPGLRTIISISG
jgi:hypothetical protein